MVILPAPTSESRACRAGRSSEAPDCSQVHGAAEATALPGLDDFSAQSCRRDRRDGSFRGADDFVPASVWLADPAPRSAPDLMAGGPPRTPPPSGSLTSSLRHAA